MSDFFHLRKPRNLTALYENSQICQKWHTVSMCEQMYVFTYSSTQVLN